MLARPSARRTYSTKSVEFARRVSPVRWSRTLRPDEPGTKWTRSPPMSACGLPGAVVQDERPGRVGDGPLHDLARKEDAFSTGVQWQPMGEQALAHLRSADLHADLGQHPLGLVDDPGDQLVAQDVQARTHPRSFVPIVGRWSAMGIPMPSTLRLMRPAVPHAPERGFRVRRRRRSAGRRSSECHAPEPVGTWVATPWVPNLGSRAICASGSPWTRKIRRG